MSFSKPCLYKGKALEQQWMNTIFNSHDLFCGCSNPIDHIKKIQSRDKWLHTKNAATTTDNLGNGDDGDFHIDEGDLQKLFEKENNKDG